MRRLVFPLSLVLLAGPAGTLAAQTLAASSEGDLAGAREIGFFVTGRVLSRNYTAGDSRPALGGAVSAAIHLDPHFAIESALGIAYSNQGNTDGNPSLFTLTPILSLVAQASTVNQFQPYGMVGAGYELVGFTHSGCACGKGKTIAIANVGAGVRKMMTDRSAFRIEASSQIGNGTPAFGMAMGMSFLVGRSPSIVKTRPTPPERIKPEPPVSVPPEGAPVQSPASPQPETPARVIPQDVVPSTPAPNLAGTVLLTIDGTQVDFNKPTWRDDAEPLLDGLAVDLTSDAGEKINISIEAHTDDIGSRMGNVALGMDRAKAVREFLVNQGINADRIAISSAGGDNPIAPNATALGRQRNRRIVIRRTN